MHFDITKLSETSVDDFTTLLFIKYVKSYSTLLLPMLNLTSNLRVQNVAIEALSSKAHTFCLSVTSTTGTYTSTFTFCTFTHNLIQFAEL